MINIKLRTTLAVGLLATVGAFAAGAHFVNGPFSPGSQSEFDQRLVAYTSPQDAHVNDDDYPAPNRNYTFASDYTAPDSWGGFDSLNCTSFVAWRVTSRDHFDMAAWSTQHRAGDANNWLNSFKNLVRQDQVPAPGSVGVRTRGKYGHVAWVKAVNTDGSILIEDYNANVTGQYGSWVVPASDFAGYLHFEDSIPKPPPAPPAPTTLTVVPNTGTQGGSAPGLQGSQGTGLQGGTGSTLQGTQGTGLQGGPGGAVQGPTNSGAGGGDGAAAAAQQQANQEAAAAAQRQAEQQAAQHPVYPVMNTSETAPDGVWWRNSPNQNDTSRITGFGVYANDHVRLTCYALGGPAINGNHVWYKATNLTHPYNGGDNSGWLSAHYINDGTGPDQVAANVQHC